MPNPFTNHNLLVLATVCILIDNFSLLEKRFNELDKKCDDIIQGVEFRSKLREHLINNINKLEKNYEEQFDYINKFKKAKMVIQKITDSRNEGAKAYIKDIVNKGLTTILGDHLYDLVIQDDNRGDSQKITEIALISTETGKPRKVGTAVKQITSVLFIISLIEMAGCSRVLVLDEYLSGASGETAKKLSDILVALSKNNDFQIFVVNHVLEISDNLEVERIYLKHEKDKVGLVLDEEKTNKEKKRRHELLQLSIINS